jgi:hypothetical protein
MRIFALCCLFSTALFLSGCASLSKEECISGNWQQIGYDDGAKGYDARSRLREHLKSCSEHGIRIDSDKYTTGHKNGLKKYCTPHNGRRVGEQGLHYAGVCPAELENNFLIQYDHGKKIHQAIQEYNQTKRDISDKENALKKEPDARIREALRSEISALDKLLRSQDREIDRIRDNAPAF